MWDDYGIFIILGFAFIALMLSYRVWGDALYSMSKHWRLFLCLAVFCGAGGIAAAKQHEFKNNLAYYYFTGTKATKAPEARYQIRQCKEFIQAKLDGRTAADRRSITAGFFKIGHISNWEFCARTFGLNYWKHDITISGQNGGRLLCEAYARDTYRSGKVENWCDTVFAPQHETTTQTTEKEEENEVEKEYVQAQTQAQKL